MAIPDIPIFNEFLSSVTLDPPSNSSSYRQLELIPISLLSESGDRRASRARATEQVFIWYGKSSELKLESVVSKLCDELKAKDHFAEPVFARILLALFCLMPRIANSPAGCLNKILSFIGNANCSWFLITPYPPHPDSRPFKLGSFIVGPLNRGRLVYRCKKVNCDYFDRYPNQFMKQDAIEREPALVRVLDFGNLRKISNFLDRPHGRSLVDYYFTCLSDLQRNVFFQEFSDSQDVLVAAGAPSIQIDNLLKWKDCAFISIFQDIQSSGIGYFCPQGQYLKIDFAQADRRIPEKVEELKNKFNFNGLGANELHNTLRTYCRFVTKAKNHKNNHRNDEAFLHYVIALDLLFGDKKSSTQNVARRTAIIVSKAVDKRFREKIIVLQDLYDRRSKYVHLGKSISKNDISIIEPIIDEVLHCLLRLQAIPENNQPGFIESWLKGLDYLSAAVEAGKTPGDQEFMTHGIELSLKLKDHKNESIH